MSEEYNYGIKINSQGVETSDMFTCKKPVKLDQVAEIIGINMSSSWQNGSLDEMVIRDYSTGEKKAYTIDRMAGFIFDKDRSFLFSL